MFNFEKFDVWHKAVAFTDRVYAVTSTFPESVRFGLTSQMRRAAVSVSSSIAEGSSRSSRLDFADLWRWPPVRCLKLFLNLPSHATRDF